jgi:hypothetical protein
LLSLAVPITILSYPTTAVGGKVLYKFADEKEKEMHRGREMKVMVNMLSQYKKMCGTRKVMLFILIFELLQIMQCLFGVIW